MNKRKNSLQILWIFTKYQIITKGIIALLLFLFHEVLIFILNMSGRANITSGDIVSFLKSFWGIIFIIILLSVLLLLIAIDINSFIIISALIIEGNINFNYLSVLIHSFKSITPLLSFSGIFVCFYIAIIIPAIGVGITIEPLNKMKIPNFIKAVIFDTPLYSFIYWTTIVLLTIITLLFIFSLHFIIIDRTKTIIAMKKSLILMKKYWKSFVFDIFIKKTIKIAFFLFIFIVFCGIIIISLNIIFREPGIKDIINIFIFLFGIKLFTYLSFIIVPYEIYEITKEFYKFNELNKEPKTFINSIKEKTKTRNRNLVINAIMNLSLLLIVVFFILNTFSEAKFIHKSDLSLYFGEKNKLLIAHRGGGNLSVENTLLGIKLAIKEGANGCEVDVQRTKDHHYILNHDNNFKRLWSEQRRSTELTLNQIKELKCKSQPNATIPTVEEVLDTCNGRMKVFLELKGETADEEMADDLVRLIEKKKMKNQVVLISLKLDLVQYIKGKYRDIETGYLYFFALGDVGKINCDYLIMEENQCSASKVFKLHKSGKKVLVWTVNTNEAIKEFTQSNVDGIITDNVKNVKKELQSIRDKSFFDLYLRR